MMLTVCPEMLALRCPDQHFLLACGWLASGNPLTNPQKQSPDMPEKSIHLNTMEITVIVVHLTCLEDTLSYSSEYKYNRQWFKSQIAGKQLPR